MDKVTTNIKKESKNNKQAKRTKVLKILMTFCLLLTWISMGLYMELTGPTLKDIILRLCSSNDEVSSAISGRSAGKFIGVVIGGLLVSRFESFCNLLLGVSLTLAAAATLLFPWIYSVTVLWFLYCVLGITLGLIDIAGQRLVLVTWLEKAASPMHVIHLGYGIGGFLDPLIANPFLADDLDSTIHMLDNVSSSTTEPSSNKTCRDPEESSIQYAYTLIGALTAVLSIVFYVFQFTEFCKFNPVKNDFSEKEKQKKEKSRLKDLLRMVNPASCADGNFCFGITILLLLFLKFFLLTGFDRVFGTFLRSFAIDQLHFSKDSASYLNTIYWICYAVSRFIIFIAARWISVKIILLVETIVLSLGMILWIFFGLHNGTVFWVVAIVAGLFYGPTFPTGIAWGDAYIEMTGLAITWTLLGSAIGGLIYLQFAGKIYDTYGPSVLAYTCTGTAVGMLLTDVMLTITGRCRSRFTRFTKESKKNSVKYPEVETTIENSYL